MTDTPAPLSADSLHELDKFMFSMGFELYPSLENTQPWNTRYYRPDTLELTDGRKNTYHMTVDSAVFWHGMFAAAVQSERQRIADSLPEKREPKNLHMTTDNGGFLGNYCDTCKIYTFDKDTFEETGAWCLCYPFNEALEAVRAVLIPPRCELGDSKTSEEANSNA